VAATRTALSAVRVRVSIPRAGYLHPLGRARIKEALDFFGPLALYGLGSIELRQAIDGPGDEIRIARLRVPGSVVLYEQLEPPWFIRGLSTAALADLERAGATVNIARPGVMRVDWASEDLADFMLFNGLLHEVGHHLIQHHTGRRTVRVMRTADHERRARAFAAACRRAWETAHPRA
jgi:hypothetical protein